MTAYHDDWQWTRAKRRILDVAATLNVDVDLPLEPSRVVDTAVWAWSWVIDGPVIFVNLQLALELPERCLQALLLHELLHHRTYNEFQHRFPRGTPDSRKNLAFDIAIERDLARSCHAESALELNRRLLDPLLLKDSGTLSMQASLILLAHRGAPVERLAEEIGQLWQRYWDDLSVKISPLEIDRDLSRQIPSHCFSNEAIVHEERLPLGPPVRFTERFIPTGYGSLEGEDDLAEVSGRALTLDQAGNRKRCISASAFLAAIRDPLGLNRAEEAVRLNACEIVHKASLTSVGDGWAREVADMVVGTGSRQRVARLPYLVRPTRAELVRRSVDWPSILFSNERLAEDTACRIYVDISESMDELRPIVMGILKELTPWLPQQLFAFDERVYPLSRHDLARGLWLGGGTEFDAVFEHAMATPRNRCLVITDGLSTVSDEVLAASRARSCVMTALLLAGPDDDIMTYWWTQWALLSKDELTGQALLWRSG